MASLACYLCSLKPKPIPASLQNKSLKPIQKAQARVLTRALTGTLTAILTGIHRTNRRIHRSTHSNPNQTPHGSNPRSIHRRTNKQFRVFAWVLSLGGISWMLFVQVLRWYPSKPSEKPARTQNKSSKPIQKASTNNSPAAEYRSKAVETHAPEHKRLTARALEARGS